MKGFSRTVSRLIAAGTVLCIAFGCSEEFEPTDTPSLLGDYSGSISIWEGVNDLISQDIDWRFDDGVFVMWLRGEESGREFCDVSGTYNYEYNQFEMTIDSVWVTDGGTCDQSRNPSGLFTIDRSTDSLKLIRYDSERDCSWFIALSKTGGISSWRHNTIYGRQLYQPRDRFPGLPTGW